MGMSTQILEYSDATAMQCSIMKTTIVSFFLIGYAGVLVGTLKFDWLSCGVKTRAQKGIWLRKRTVMSGFFWINVAKYNQLQNVQHQEAYKSYKSTNLICYHLPLCLHRMRAVRCNSAKANSNQKAFVASYRAISSGDRISLYNGY